MMIMQHELLLTLMLSHICFISKIAIFILNVTFFSTTSTTRGYGMDVNGVVGRLASSQCLGGNIVHVHLFVHTRILGLPYRLLKS